MTTWIISDLHLCAQRPAVTQAFLHWLRTEVTTAEALYILGDFVEVWVGDDILADPQHGAEFVPIVQALRALSDQGVKLYFMHGNRDFLIGQGFAQASGLQLLSDPTLLTLGETRILLSHGDALCTDDVAYQQFRSQVRTPQWQQAFLSQPLAARLAFAEQARQQSTQNKAMHAQTTQPMDIMDVNAAAVLALLRQYDYPDILLHGHTHRPGRHPVQIDGHVCERIVLGDWHDDAVCARWDAHGLQLHTLSLLA
ncbi:UDP-2,3-diacylglucosamine diphosphatase [Methylophilus sp. UBA6697]|jgi:UDP-2,3-diacylglucosamine hydrolase|uniref:UDP-2,3-diacylglucosamine diphosphatase n=1 Tax=Methylophilus sp. UBA6697 TaxID=1946902 RepID=UPI000EBDFFEE|nr:UDP-2,3-diacylglucosamine diphosphatase [Methylophilus sp. UBA6697]HCU85276.1 UDP-2,3-diacylglucosamine diphosphatase [Methylophilus sp.]